MATKIERGKVLTGARVRLEIDGRAIGHGTVASYTESIGYDPITVLDHLEVVEHVPVAYDVAFTASRIYLVTKDLKDAATALFPTWPAGGDSTGFLFNILQKAEMQASIIDRVGTDEQNPGEKTIVQLQGVKIASHNLTFGARAIVGQDIAFVARRALTGPELS